MNILIAGASGFIGKKLVKALESEHTIRVLGRDIEHLKHNFSGSIKISTWETLSQLDASVFDVIINLCGYNIAASRWSAGVKKQLIDSRVKTSSSLIDWAKRHNAKPHFICANAVGIYGIQDSQDAQTLDEFSPINFENPCDFLSEIGCRWQQALQPAVDFGMPVTITRFGVVLGRGEGMLKKLAPSFKLGLGSIIGDGKQVISWVDSEDLVAALLFLIKRPELTGAFNLTSPNPVTQAQFAQILATSLHRPLLLKMPAFVVRALFGEMGESLLLKGQRVIPTRLLQSGFKFKYPELSQSLNHAYS
ncbi:MAG: TIGR01777 family protein [Legionella sp.]|nr:TIGR01777 family protein [Legionella sp.]